MSNVSDLTPSDRNLLNCGAPLPRDRFTVASPYTEGRCLNSPSPLALDGRCYHHSQTPVIVQRREAARRNRSDASERPRPFSSRELLNLPLRHVIALRWVAETLVNGEAA